MLRQQIENTKAFKKLEPFQQDIVSKRANRLQIEDAIVTARNIGYANWEKTTPLPAKWREIVKEITNE